ncbi:MAG: MBL fold metallo-hydrolase [Thermoleophilaceae bacterium]|nr:MBL fold metallo-hydrolase [Thermoleophilaceae bacterium]
MRLTVLGKSPSWQDANGACSGYLVEHEDTTILLECGNGVFGKLRQLRDYTRVDAVVVSHMHSDHFFDLIPYSYALLYAPRQQPVPVARWSGTDSPARPALHLPPGGEAVGARVTGAFDTEDLLQRAFEVQEYKPEDALTIDGVSIRFCSIPHFIDAFAVELTDPTGKRIVYGSDCCPNEAIIEFARGAELLLLEATLPRPERSGVRGHLTPTEAGEHAKQAGVKRLVLTHISDELDLLWAEQEAEEAFGQPVKVAHEGATYSV